MTHKMLARVAKYMMCNRQVEAVKPFREPFKVIPRPENGGNKSPQQAVLRQEILQKLGRQRLDRTFEVLRGRSVPKFKVYDANNELLIAQRTQVNPMLTESNDSQKMFQLVCPHKMSKKTRDALLLCSPTKLRRQNCTDRLI